MNRKPFAGTVDIQPTKNKLEFDTSKLAKAKKMVKLSR